MVVRVEMCALALKEGHSSRSAWGVPTGLVTGRSKVLWVCKSLLVSTVPVACAIFAPCKTIYVFIYFVRSGLTIVKITALSFCFCGL